MSWISITWPIVLSRRVGYEWNESQCVIRKRDDAEETKHEEKMIQKLDLLALGKRLGPLARLDERAPSSHIQDIAYDNSQLLGTIDTNRSVCAASPAAPVRLT